MLKKGLILSLLLFPFLPNLTKTSNWGFFAHKELNRIAVFTLPPQLIGFYKRNIDFIVENSVSADMRRYSQPDEAPRHYIDLDVYGANALDSMPKYWMEAVKKFTEDTLLAYGINPWHIYKVKNYLTRAFLEKNHEQILRLSADIGHYIADANVPLHTTENYNGQFTGQRGIHGLWESRLPELFSSQYDLFTGPASYIEDPQGRAWQAIGESHRMLDSVLNLESDISRIFEESRKYSYEERGGRMVRVYSYEFSEKYHQALDGMVEKRMKSTIKMIGDFWYTSWVDAGQPKLLEEVVARSNNDTFPTLGVPGLKLREHESVISN